MKRIPVVSACMLVALCCHDVRVPTDLPEQPQFEIVDGAHSGNEHFFFLPPLVPQPSYAGTFDGSLSPVVRITVGSETIADLTPMVNTADEQYHANWFTKEYELDVTKTLRIAVLVDGWELGYADVDVVADGNELRNVETGEYIPLMDGRTLPIKFRIEERAFISGRLAYASDSSGNLDIYTMNANGSNLQRLTFNTGIDHEPSWSPDGSKIAFRTHRDGNNSDIYVMNGDGTNLSRLTTNTGQDEGPNWSPDGTRIAFSSVRGGRTWDIYVMNADGSGQTQMTTDPLPDGEPAWSPDGNRIVFSSQRSGSNGSDVYVMDAHGVEVNLERLTSAPGYDRGPAWSPDGSMIAFQRGADDGAEIYVLYLDGSGREVNLTNNSIHDGAPEWLPDGSGISFMSNRDGLNAIFVMEPDGTNVRKLTGGFGEHHHAWTATNPTP